MITPGNTAAQVEGDKPLTWAFAVCQRVELRGLEPLTPALQRQCSAS